MTLAQSFSGKLTQNFELEKTTVWSFPKRGNWATHLATATYRGNFPPQVPRNLILRYSRRGETVLDPFVGSGTTLIECKLLGRKGIGVDINPFAIELCKSNLKSILGYEVPQIVKVGDARNIDFVEDESIDLIVTHPPYANAISYSKNIKGDLSHISDVNEFTSEMKTVATELFRVLKPNRCCAILIGDLRKNKRVVPLGFKIFNTFLEVGFIAKEIIIKIQHNCKKTNYWDQKSAEMGFLLLAHEYLFVFEKPLKSRE
jgi:DNA modification methylase